MGGLDRLKACAGTWRGTNRLPGNGSLQVLMYNIDPDGREEPAVEAKYARA